MTAVLFLPVAAHERLQPVEAPGRFGAVRAEHAGRAGQDQRAVLQQLHPQNRWRSVLSSFFSFSFSFSLSSVLGTSPHLLLGELDRRLRQGQLPRGSTGTSSGNCQEMET